MVRSHIKCFAFFSKTRSCELRAAASCPFFELVRPRFSPWAPLYLCIEHKAPHRRGSFMSTLLPAERCDSAAPGRLVVNTHLYPTLNYGTSSEHLEYSAQNFMVLYNVFVPFVGVKNNRIVTDLDQSHLTDTRSSRKCQYQSRYRS